MSETLKPCPFCGEPGYEHFGTEEPGDYEVGCSNSSCIVCSFVDAHTLDKAVAAWYTRPTHDALVAALRYAASALAATGCKTVEMKAAEREAQEVAFLESVWKEVADTGYTVTVGGCPFHGSIHRLSLAAAFTEKRLEEIGQVKEEITWLEYMSRNLPPGPPMVEERTLSLQRILAREQSALDELCLGIRPEVLA